MLDPPRGPTPRTEATCGSIHRLIRQAALGQPAAAFPDRVKQAITRVMQTADTRPAKKWLRRNRRQIRSELVVDRVALDEQRQGGWWLRIIDKRFDGRLASAGGHNRNFWKATA